MLVTVTVEQKASPLENLLHKYEYNKSLRVTAYVQRFVRNARKKGVRGPLTLSEITLVENWWTKRLQGDIKETKMPLVEDEE